MFDKLKDDPKLQSIIIIAGTAIIIALSILFLIIIWIPKDNKNNETVLNTGEYTNITLQTDDVLKRYVTNINNVFSAGDNDFIAKYIDKEYLNFIGIKDNNVKDFLINKGIIGKLLKYGNYKVDENIRFGKIYAIDVETYDNSFSDKMYIIEKYPNDYKITFDNFIGYKKVEKNYTNEGLTLIIHDVKELTNKITFNTTVVNNTNKNLIFNNNNKSEPIYTNNNIKMSSDYFMGIKKEVLPGDKINITMNFNTEFLATGHINEIIIKDVYNLVDDENKEYKFNIR
ncbi:MAG: hypothetical protein RSE41_09790 [Clostridia bacterium]